jgi:flagellar motor component MotA
MMTSTLEPTLDAMLPAIAVALVTPLYGYFFKILAMQLD